MKDNHKLALYVAYYLSRFHVKGRDKLGYTTWTAAYQDIGSKLECNPTNVNRWRDEFDPLFGFNAGFHKRPMSPSRIVVAQSLEHLPEESIFTIVKAILAKEITSDTDDGQLLLTNLAEKGPRVFSDRGTTGKKAEEFYRQHHKTHKLPLAGELQDCREEGKGYDFKIETSTSPVFVEVKGLAGASGGVLFTDKEWSVALNEGDSYYLCLVSNVANEPEIRFIQNPAQKLSPKRHLHRPIQVSWGITENQLSAIDD